MPRFGGFNTGNIGGALARNALGSIANAVLPRTTFGGFGVKDNTGVKFPEQNAQDRVVSLRPKPAAANRVYGNGLLSPLKQQGGLIWPYTPTITYQHPITYETVSVTHANQDFMVYAKTPAVKLQVSGEFSVQNQQEGAYAFAAMHFLRTMAKMHFGESDPQAGTPPPVLLFNAYGAFMFKDVPVIVNDFSMDFPNDVDYVQVNITGSNTVVNPGTPDRPEVVVREAIPESNDGPGHPGSARLVVPARPGIPSSTTTSPATYTVWMPSVFKIACTLVVQHTPNELRKRFNLPKYINGDPSQKDFV
jgi:hypothetical protein